MSRYVILHHTDAPGGDHYDLMLERDGTLKTWEIQSTDLSTPQPAIAKADHRMRYLDYQGLISKGRGFVARVASGTFEILQWSDEEIRVRMDDGDTRILVRVKEHWELTTDD